MFRSRGRRRSFSRRPRRAVRRRRSFGRRRGPLRIGNRM